MTTQDELPDAGPNRSAAPQAVIVVAMPEEAAPFYAAGETVGPTLVVGGATLRRVTIAGRDLLVVHSGIGVANSAAAAAAALSGLAHRGTSVPVLISAGSAGGLGVDVRVGDVIVGDEYTYSQADARAFGYALGQVPGMPVRFFADARWHAAALDQSASVPDATLRTGLMLSGDSFVGPKLVGDVRRLWPDGLSVDMETTALAQTAYRFGVPFVSVRGVSDLCGPAGEFAAHVDDAADRSAAVVIAMLLAGVQG